MELRPAVHVAPPPSGAAAPSKVERMDVDSGRRKLVAHMFVSPRMLAQAVDDQDRCPRRPGVASRDPTRWPMTNQEVRAVGGGHVADERCHPGTLPDQYHSRVSTWVQIGDRVFVRRYEFYDQNIGVVLGAGAALVIDTRSTHAQAREILGDLRMLTSDPVTVVVDTHGHFDHAFGNHVFRPATIWGHAGCPRFLARTAERRRARVAVDEPSIAADLAEVVIDPPARTFETATTI